MECRTEQTLRRIYRQISAGQERLRCVVGFDAFIDHLFRVVRSSGLNGPEYFVSSQDFAKYLLGMGAMSGALELERRALKYGGNNPLLAFALGSAGIHVDSIGAYGYEHLRSAFSPLARCCTLHSFANPGECYAYEFDQNKIMTFVNMDPADFTYERMTERVGYTILQDVVRESGLLALLNYSEQPAVLQIWNGILEDGILEDGQKHRFFFDLSDCSRLAEVQIEACFDTIGRYRKLGDTYLSLNENEFQKLCSLFTPEFSQEDLWKDTGRCVAELCKRLPLRGLFLRTLRRFYAAEAAGVVTVDNIIEEKPRCLTGAGDNQNAGICLGLLCDMELQDCLLLGVHFGNYYISHGKCGSLEEVLHLSGK